MAVTGTNKGVYYFNVASGLFKCHFNVMMWLHSTLKKSSWMERAY